MLKLLRNSLILLLAVLCIVPFGAFVSANEAETVFFHVDSLNGTRWENYICVYKDVETTKQNQWGYNIVIDSDGVVTELIAAGDAKGENLAVPNGGMVLSGTGTPGEAMFNSVSLGDKVVFDEYAMRALVTSGDINPFYTTELAFSGYNTPRNSETVIIYNRGGQTTGTNSYGYEVTVNKDGYVIACGGNDNPIPQDGYVISAVGQDNMAFLKLWLTLGTKCEIDGKKIKVSYTESELKKTAELELDLVKTAFDEAKAQYRLIDYSAAESAINSINTDNITDLQQRNEVISQIKNIKILLLEQKKVQTRGVWYVPEEYSAADIKPQVQQMVAAGINELALYVDSHEGTLIPIPETIPFAVDNRTKEFDLLQTYIDECHANGITLVVVLPVMQNSLGKDHPDWFCVDSAGNPTNQFYSPANNEYKEAFKAYLTYILENYDVDGLQLDYIRYPEFNGVLDFGYDEASIEAFKADSGLEDSDIQQIKTNLTRHSKWSVWRGFKARLVNGWVKDCYEILDEKRPELLMSAAVAEGGSLETYCQDFAAWLEGGYIDGIYPMTYITGVNQPTINKFSKPMTGKSFLVMGCGAYLSYTNEHILDETCNAAVYGADGLGYFEWTAVVDHGYDKFFAESMFTSSAIPFTADMDKVINGLVETAKERIKLYNGENADEVKNLINSVGTEKKSLKDARDSASELLAKDDEKWLLADIDTAIRVYDIYGIKAEDSVDGEISDGSEDSLPEEEASGDEDGGSTGTIIAVFVCVVAVAICAIAVALKKKK